MLSGTATSVLLGSAAIAHPYASDLHVLAQFIAEQTGATLGFLPVGGNAVGASLVNANGAGVESVLSGERRAVQTVHDAARNADDVYRSKVVVAKLQKGVPAQSVTKTYCGKMVGVYRVNDAKRQNRAMTSVM